MEEFEKIYILMELLYLKWIRTEMYIFLLYVLSSKRKIVMEIICKFSIQLI